MEPNNTQPNIHERVTEAIQSGKVSMRSPVHFILRTAALIIAVCGVFILSSIILNFILFSIHAQSHHELLGFGFFGILAFLIHFPWILFFTLSALVAAVVYLVRSFRWGYTMPTIYIGGALVFIVLLAGHLIEGPSERMNVKVMHRESEGGMRMPLRVIDDVRVPPAQMRPLCRCEIVEIGADGHITARDTRNDVVRTFIIRTPSAYATTSGLMRGDIVFIAGRFDSHASDTVNVFGIKRIGSE